MLQKNSDKEKPTAATTLRRSPRFLQSVLANPEDPKTPKPDLRKRTHVPSSATALTLTGKRNVYPRKSCRSKEICLAQQARKISGGLKTSTRRSARLNRCADECDVDTLSCSSNRKNSGLKRPLTRSLRSSCRDVDENAQKPGYGESMRDTNEGILAVIEKPVLDEELSEKRVGKKPNGVVVSTATVIHEGATNENNINVGVKKRRIQHENFIGGTPGWTKDQESALERAYLLANPTPHFWKKVSKLVPGKSAQECFDKIHGSHLTPPPPQLRSRPRVSNPQNQTFSASKLLNSSSSKGKTSRQRKQKRHVVQRTVRHMLQNQYKVEQDSETDLFSVLEPTFTPFSNSHLTLGTPDHNLEASDILERFQERSSTAHKKSVSRFSGSSLVSPPVLKQVKNMALHERYIDQLNCREASRKAASAKMEKRREGSSVKRKKAVKAAKNALAIDARDAISKFQRQEVAALIDFSDDEIGADEDNSHVFV